MDNMVEKYINENNEELRRQLLDKLNLFDFEKEYAPETIDAYQAQRLGYSQAETVDGITRYYKRGKKIYPQITDDEYEKLILIAREKDRIQEREENERKKNNPEKKSPYVFDISAENTNGDRFASTFMKWLAVILWIGGLFVAITSARVEVQGYYSTYTTFSWTIFVSNVVIYFTTGALCMCLSEALNNLQIIASAICRFSAHERKN